MTQDGHKKSHRTPPLDRTAPPGGLLHHLLHHTPQNVQNVLRSLSRARDRRALGYAFPHLSRRRRRRRMTFELLKTLYTKGDDIAREAFLKVLHAIAA